MVSYLVGSTSPPLRVYAGAFCGAENARILGWAEPGEDFRAPRASFDDGGAPWSAPLRVPVASRTGPTEKEAKVFRILIADDHEAIRRGLRSALTSAGWQVCGEALDGKEAIRQADALKPDLVVLDISMPNLGGLEAAREILRNSPETKVLIFTMHESRQMRVETQAIGVHGIAVKSAPLSNLLASIDSILRSS